MLGSWFRDKPKMPTVSRGEARQLTSPQRAALLQMTTTQGWETYLDLFEEECLAAFSACLNATKEDDILATQRVAHAYSQCFVKMQRRVLFETEAMTEPKQQHIDDKARELLETVGPWGGLGAEE